MSLPDCECSDYIRISTSEPVPYHPGFFGVTLVGVDLAQCVECGYETPIIPKISAMARALAAALVSKPGRLTGPEFRFLRLTAGISADELAVLADVHLNVVRSWDIGGPDNRYVSARFPPPLRYVSGMVPDVDAEAYRAVYSGGFWDVTVITTIRWWGLVSEIVTVENP